MYKYKRAVGVNKIIPRGLELLDISTELCSDLMKNYNSLIIVIADQIALREVSFNAIDYRNELISYDDTIQSWLDLNINTPLKTSNELPLEKYNYVTTADIQYKNFCLLPGNVDLAEDRQKYLTVEGGKDIRIKRWDVDKVDYSTLVNKTLWTINGHLVRAILGKDSIYLVNAGNHFKVRDNVHINCLNFEGVSNLKTYPLLLEDIRFTGDDEAGVLHYKTNLDLKDKTTWLVIGGRLYFNDVINVRSNNSIKIDITKVDWFSRIFDSKDYIDLSSVIDKERRVVNKDFFKTESFFLKLLTDPSSFLVVLDNPNVYVETRPIETYRYPFTYHTTETKDIPLLTGGGLLPKYFVRSLINRRLLDTDIGIQRKYVNKTTGEYNEGELLHNFTNRFKPSRLHSGYLLYIRGLEKGGSL